MSHAILLAVLAACAAALYGLLAIWAALGRGHWFVRAAVVAGAIGMLLPVPAFDLAIVFLSQSLVIAVPLLLFEAVCSAKRRNIANPPEEAGSAASGHRFALVDLFLLTLGAAGIASLGAYLPAKHRDFWPSYVMIGAGAGVASLAAAWAALGRRWPWLRWALLMAVAPSVGFALRVVELPEEFDVVLFSFEYSVNLNPGSPAWFSLAVVCSSGLAVAAWLVFLKHSGWLAFLGRDSWTTSRAEDSTRRRLRLRVERIGIVLFLLAASGVIGIAYLKMLFPLPIPRVDVPNPNGYLVLVKLGDELEHSSILAADPPGEAETREFVDANTQQLMAAHAALALPHVVPVDYESANLPWIESLGAFRQLARALVCEGRSAILDGRPDDAVSSYCDVVRLGDASARGGLRVDSLIGRAFKGVGLHHLCNIRESLSPKMSRQLIEALQRLDAGRESTEAVSEREAIWRQHAYGWAGRLFPDPDNSSPQTDRILADVHSANTRLLICDLATRLHLAEHGRLPEELQQLVPKYLGELPGDPFSGRPFVYRPEGATIVLYSVGPDRKDDGGARKINDAPAGDGDLLLDPPEAAAALP